MQPDMTDEEADDALADVLADMSDDEVDAFGSEAEAIHAEGEGNAS